MTFCLFGCATQNVSVDSLPTGADVKVRRMSGSQEVVAGKTPIALSSSQLENLVQGSGPILLTFDKDGFHTQKLLITELGSTFDLKVNIKLQEREKIETLEEGQTEEEKALILQTEANKKNDLITKLFDSQNLARQGNYTTALERLEEIRKIEPRLSVVHELKGGIYLLQDDYTRALSSFREAFRYDPENPEISNLIRYVERKLESGAAGTRLPARSTVGGGQ